VVGDLKEFMALVGIALPEQFRGVTRAHVLASRESLEQRGLHGAMHSPQARCALVFI
jgi:hypothetical protein